jgi:hypothetical protein
LPRLSDGDYRLEVRAGTVVDNAGNPLPADVGFDFTHLAGDANRDRAVNFADLAILAQNYGQPGKHFGEGDFDHDGRVGFSDLVILAQRYNTVLPPPPSAQSAPLRIQARRRPDPPEVPPAAPSVPARRPSPARRGAPQRGR